MNKSFTRAFTLIELLVVISIIAVLSSIVLAALSSARSKASIAAGQTFEAQMYQAYGANATAIWAFDDGAGSTTAADSSGNNANLTITSPAVIETTNVFRGKSALYIPNTSIVQPAYTSSGIPNFSTANGSISFWIDLVAAGDQDGVFCSQTYFQFCIASSDTNTGNFIQMNWGVNNFTSGISVRSVLGTWTQVALSWNATAGTMTMYVNGNQVATHSYTAPALSSLNFCVGGDCSGDDMWGYVDEMRVYTQSLQTGQIEKIYAEELPRHEHPLAFADTKIR